MKKTKFQNEHYYHIYIMVAQRKETESIRLQSNRIDSVSISLGEAQMECQLLGAEYHLISENEWMTIAENIIRVADNDIDDETEGMQLATTSAEYLLTNDNIIPTIAI